MDITKIDTNFKQTDVEEFFSKVYELPNKNFTLLGGYYDEKLGFIKMPEDLAKEISEGVAWGSRCTAGVRLLFSTNSKIINLYGKIFAKCLMNHMAFIGSACFTLCEVENGKEEFICNLCPAMQTDKEEFSAQGSLKGNKVRDFILYFPLYSGVENLTIELEKNSIVKSYNKYVDKKPILYYGSSITQGGCASRTDNCYQALVSEWTNLDYYILGFSGSAKAELKMIDYLANFDCSIFVCDYDYNASSVEFLQKTHLPLYKMFRSIKKNVNTPIVFISKPDGYRGLIGKRRFEIIKSTYEYALSLGDKNVYLIDGRNIYPKNIREHCSVDGCHPTDLGFYFYAKKLYKLIKTVK